MSQFTKMMGAGLGELMRLQSDSAIYHPPAAAAQADPIEVTAIIGNVRLDDVDSENGIRQVARRDVLLITDSTHPKYSGISRVERRGKFQIAHEYWNVVDIRSDSDNSVIAELQRVSQREVSGRDYRNR